MGRCWCGIADLWGADGTWCYSSGFSTCWEKLSLWNSYQWVQYLEKHACSVFVPSFFKKSRQNMALIHLASNFFVTFSYQMFKVHNPSLSSHDNSLHNCSIFYNIEYSQYPRLWGLESNLHKRQYSHNVSFQLPPIPSTKFLIFFIWKLYNHPYYQ